MKERPPAEWAIRLVASAAVLIAGWYLGSWLGAGVGICIDSITHTDFGSYALLTIPVFGLAGSIAGLSAGYLILRRNPSPN